MKIAMITPVFPPYLSGISRVAEQEARGLAERRHEVTVVTPWYHQGLLKNERTKDYKIKRLKTFLKFGNAAWLLGLRNAVVEGDIIHLHYPFIGAVNPILKSKIPLIVTYHMDLVGRGWKGLFFKIYTRLTLPRLIRQADKILVSSLDYARHGRLKEYLERYPEKFSEVPFGVEVKNKEQRTKNKWRNATNERVILFVGALDKAHYFKGVDVLLQSFKQICSLFLVPCSLFIIGDGDLRPYYEKQAKELGIGDKVNFVGRVEEDKMADYYQSADVLVLPSFDKSEAYGMVILEALGNGLPVIASDLPGVRTLIASERGRLVPPGNKEELAAALIEIFSDEEKRREMGERGRAWVEKNRSLVMEIDKLEKIYQSLII